MPTSSITHDFTVVGNEAAERFANAIEESYQQSLKEKDDFENIKILSDPEELKEYFKGLDN